ncbi:MAG: Re/Si-specific NAD(P)(+) transhydrogenase subunit alpha [Proteobacteria bacterium]|nr:Re/Si-specific NAD(P)(+) transhydrogenase subunit alpha [Pseudomonadota bacterium]
MIVGVPREIVSGERRIALIPASVARLAKAGLEIRVQAEGGAASDFPDAEYEAAGAKLVDGPAPLYDSADLLVKVRPPAEHPWAERHEVDLLREGAALVGILQPYLNPVSARRLAERRITSFALDLLPRITRAQNMDVLSSQSTIAGYKAVLLAANALPKLMPMMMTAAGTLRPARMLVLGAGVAGLQAIATARRLGAIVEAFDIRSAVKEQVESLGARFVAEEALAPDAEDATGYAKEVAADQQARQRQLLERHIREADVVLCSALVPGKRAPRLLTREQVEQMKPGSIVMDLAAEQGGNCQLTRAGEIVEHRGVRIHGPQNLPSSMPVHASQMLSRNIENFLVHVLRDGELQVDLEDPITRSTLVTYHGEISNERVRAELERK